MMNHKLNTVAEGLGIALHHHEAGSDAYACGEILQCALRETGCTDAVELAEHLQIKLGSLTQAGVRQRADKENPRRHRTSGTRKAHMGIDSTHEKQKKEHRAKVPSECSK